MIENQYLESDKSLRNGRIKKKTPPLKNQIHIGLSTILSVALILAISLLLPKPSSASEVFGVEFNQINWEELCPNIKPLKVGECDIVHPTSGLARNFKSGFEKFSNNSEKPNCELQKEIYEKRITSSPRRCAAMFRTAYSALATSGDNGAFTAQEFRDTYLSEGVVNAEALPRH